MKAAGGIKAGGRVHSPLAPSGHSVWNARLPARAVARPPAAGLDGRRLPPTSEFRLPFTHRPLLQRRFYDWDDRNERDEVFEVVKRLRQRLLAQRSVLVAFRSLPPLAAP